MLGKLKKEYNKNLNRYYKGCQYCSIHKDEIKKWTPELLRILDNLETILKKIKEYQFVNDNEILNGFN